MASGLTFNDAIPLGYDELSESFTVSPTSQYRYFKFDVVQGESYQFTAFSDGDTYGYLYDERGLFLAQNDDDGEGYNPLIIFTATYTGFVCFAIRAYNSNSSTVYNVTVKAIHVVLPPGTTFEDAIQITDDATLVEGSVTPSYNQYFIFNVVANRLYRFQTYGEYDLYGYLYDSNKNLIAENDDGIDSNPILTYVPKSDGVMYVRIRHYSSSGSATFTAGLTSIEYVEPERPDPTSSEGYSKAVLLKDVVFKQMIPPRPMG